MLLFSGAEMQWSEDTFLSVADVEKLVRIEMTNRNDKYRPIPPGR